MIRLLTTRAFHLPFLGDIAVETYSARPAGFWAGFWREGSSTLVWMGRRLVILN